MALDKIVVDFANAPHENHDGLWVDALRSLYALSPLAGQAVPHPRLGQSWLLGHLVLSESAFTAQLIQRDKAHLNSSADMLWVGMITSGDVLGSLYEEPVHMRPGELHILDFSRAYSAKCAPSQLRSVLISHDAVGYDPSRHPAVMRVSEQNVLGRILLQTFVSVFDELDRTSKNDAPTIASSLIALVSGVIAAAPDREPDFPGFTMARNKAIRAHIERNLASHTLDLETLCSQFHMSRATLYRDFREEGGLERYILGRKLDAALMALAFGPADRGAVTRAASQWHFASVSHFSREFRRRFGFAASDVVGQHNRAMSSLSVAGNAEGAARPPDLGTFLSQL